ncbi:AI-2E family transporter [Ghiorsea bivora]|uniref:AI-2E family transporter n=1 Tax=Ghiorsea bivora TaxID=1485545 RepID=UPI000570CF77|nr:AI-2E family transporter [Ghiorsea bivora]
MAQPTPVSRGEHILLITACLIIIVVGLKLAAPLMVTLLLSAFVAIICLPPLYFLLNKGVNVSIAVFIVVGSLILIGLLVSLFAGSAIADFSRNLPFYQERIQGQTAQLIALLTKIGVEIPAGNLLESFDPSAVMKFVGSLLSGLGNALTNVFLLLLIVIFVLFEAVALPHKWAAMNSHAPSTDAFKQFLKTVHRYLVIKSMVSIATGIFITIWLSFLGVDYPVLWGLMAFLFNFVPNIGSIIAAVPAMMLATVQLGLDSAAYTALGYIIVNVIMGNVIEPRYMGKGVGLSTLVVFLSLVVWGWILGPVGMLLSVPLTMIVKLACEANPKTQWIAILLGPDINPEENQKEATQV